MDQYISIRFRKIQYIGVLIKKVSFFIKSNDKIYALSSSRSLRNGFANLYGEEIQLPKSTQQFTINVLDSNKNQIMTQFIIPTTVVMQFSKRMNAFTSQKDGLKLFWQALTAGQTSQQNCGLGRSFSQTSLQDFDFRFQSPKNIHQAIQSRENKQQQCDQIEEKSRKKKNSFKLRISDTASQPQKHEKNTTAQFVSGHHTPVPQKNLRHLQTDSFQFLGKSLGFQDDLRSSKKKQRIKQQYITRKLPSSPQATNSKTTSKPPLSQKNQILPFNNYISNNQSPLNCQHVHYHQQSINLNINTNFFQSDRNHNNFQFTKTQQNINNTNFNKKTNKHRTLHRHRSQIFNKITLKSIIATGIVGVVSGLVASTIN